MTQSKDNALAVAFTCATTINVNDMVEISAANTVAVPSGAGSIKIVGKVIKHTDDATECVVETKFRERRTDRVSGAAVSVGAFVFDADAKVINYNSGSHSPAAICGLIITTANAADVAVETLEY